MSIRINVLVPIKLRPRIASRLQITEFFHLHQPGAPRSEVVQKLYNKDCELYNKDCQFYNSDCEFYNNRDCELYIRDCKLYN